MKPFVLHNPVKLLFGRGEVDRVGDMVPAGARVLVVYGGGSVVRTGLLERIRTQLQGRAAHVVEFGGVQPNPEYAQLMTAIPLIQKESIDFLLAVGGGSVLDGTKFIAAAARFDGDPWDILSVPQPVRAAIPMGAVLTLAATGSEMNAVAVVSNAATGEKLSFFSSRVYPVFSIVDPALTETLPSRQVANGVVDAFVHVLEQYIVEEQYTPVQARFSEGILQTLIEVGPTTYRDPKNAEARDAFCYAATMALNGLIGAGVVQDWSTHNIGHELTALYGIDHARSLAAVMFDNFRLRMDVKRARLAQFGRRVWGLAGDDAGVARAALERTQAFFESLDVPTSLGAYDEVGSDVASRVVAALEQRGGRGMGEGQRVNMVLVAEILRQSQARR